MNDKFKEFMEAAEEIDELALEGFFGEDAKKINT